MKKIGINSITLVITLAFLFSSFSMVTADEPTELQLTSPNASGNYIHTLGDYGDIVWDNSMDYEGLAATQWDETSSFDTFIADDFSFEETTGVDDVHWIGGYWSGEPAEFDWCISFFIDDGTGDAPLGTDPYNPSYAGPFSYSWADITTEEIEYGYYKMSIFLPEILTFSAGEKYWISIWGVGAVYPQSGWGYHFDPVSLNPAVWGSDYFGITYWTPGINVLVDDFDMCFQLTGASYQMQVTKEIVDAQFYYGLSPYFIPIELNTNAWWDIAINVESGSEALNDILVNDSIGAKLDLVVQGFDDTYEEEITTPVPPFDTWPLWADDDFTVYHAFDTSLGSIDSVTLEIRAYDVNSEDYNQRDEIWADGNDLGWLTGTDEAYSITTFDINPAWLADGNLQVDFDLDSTSIGSRVMIDYSKLIVEYSYDYIFKLDGTPIPLLGDDNIYKGDEGEHVEWWQANKKYDPIKNPCATIIEWAIDSLGAHETTTLQFRVETIQFEVGPKKEPQMKQAFTSTCHHSLNDGAKVTFEFEGEYYDFWSNPVEVSVFDPEPGADSDGDGLEDWEEVTGEYGYITDPCCYDTDGDGFNDGYEIEHGSDPLDPECYPPSFTQADLIYSEGVGSCDYEIWLYDSWGDGWDDTSYGASAPNSLDVIVDGTLVLDDIYLATGYGPEPYIFTVNEGDLIELVYTCYGIYCSENYYELYDSNGALVDTINGDSEPYWSGIATCIGWEYALGYEYPTYEVELDGVTEWYYLDLCDEGVEVDGGPLTTDYHPFYLDPTLVPAEFYTYWYDRGVYDGCTGVWEPTMWEIIRDEPTLPMFYIKYDGMGEYMLVDGLQYALGQGDNPLRVSGDYPIGTYTFTGTITNTCGAWEDVTITIEFSPEPTILETVWLSNFAEGDAFGELGGETLTFDFSNNVYLDNGDQAGSKVYFATAADLGESATYMYYWTSGHYLFIDALIPFGTPRPDVGDYVTGFDGIVDGYGNSVVVPAGGVEIYWD